MTGITVNQNELESLSTVGASNTTAANGVEPYATPTIIAVSAILTAHLCLPIYLTIKACFK